MKPIIFSTEMVRAILDGRKTQTRRVIKPQPESMKDGKLPKCPYQPGDILWVRETWYYEEHMHELTAGDPDLPSGRYKHRYICKASDPDYPVGNKGWRPSIHMPREAARLFLLVKAVRVERLQEITEEDVLAEGCGLASWTQDDWPKTAGFAQLWDSLNAKRGYGWKNNDWVWVIEFERTEATTDEI